MTVLERFNITVRHCEPEKVPVVIYDVAPFVSRFVGVPARRYYLDAATKFSAQLHLQQEFPRALCIPGIWADFGAVAEASALGCHVVWFEDDAPYVRPALNELDNIRHLQPSNPRQDGLMPLALLQYEFMWKHLDEEYIENYGFLDGLGYSIGPLEIGAMVLGYDKFFLGFYIGPELIHKLLAITTDSVLAWLEAQQQINGKLRHLVIADHLPSQVSREHFKEFCLPYLNRVFTAFPRALKIWHNEGRVTHILDLVPDIGMDCFHYGDADPKKTKSTIGQKVALMGNVDPVNILLRGNPTQVLKACEACLKIGSPHGGFVLSSGGGLAPNTPRDNIQAMLDSVEAGIKSR